MDLYPGKSIGLRRVSIKTALRESRGNQGPNSVHSDTSRSPVISVGQEVERDRGCREWGLPALELIHDSGWKNRLEWS